MILVFGDGVSASPPLGWGHPPPYREHHADDSLHTSPVGMIPVGGVFFDTFLS